MHSAHAASRLVPGRPEQVATRVVFFIAGFVLAAWAPLVPFVKDRAGLDEAGLGLLLLCFGVGSIVAMPFAGALAARLGCRLTIAIATILVCAALPVLAGASDIALLVVALLLFGAGVGAIDVAVNIQAVIVERTSGRSMMSGFHGMFSVGGIAGALIMSGSLSLHLSPLNATFVVAGVILGSLAGFGKHLLPHGSAAGASVFALPKGKVLLLGGLCFILFLAEGAVLDWSAVFLTAQRGLAANQAGFGYAAFAVAMTLGRLNGDRVVEAAGGRTILLAGGFCAMTGFAVMALAPALSATLCGLVLVGLGCSNLVPVLYTAAGNQSVMPAGAAISAITTIGYAGILCGPALIGFAAEVTSLGSAFLGLAALLLVVAGCARIAMR